MLYTKNADISTKGMSPNISTGHTIVLSTTKNAWKCSSSSVRRMYGVTFALPLATAATLVQPYVEKQNNS